MTATALVRRTRKLLALPAQRRPQPLPYVRDPSAGRRPEHGPADGSDSGPDVWLAGLRLGS